ncbi:hypothetical protein KDK_50930 [Dictyobacter kobayashii]|uniref:Uncharacterized protein n=1 Tax=Dictyobacter kobayashii TaxID=2014872 RepID=A0A402AQ57_9CHLR|nr:hypothetical protein KDK_50930 [Dictyobacter kobayashii]
MSLSAFQMYVRQQNQKSQPTSEKGKTCVSNGRGGQDMRRAWPRHTKEGKGKKGKTLYTDACQATSVEEERDTLQIEI